MKFSTPRNNGSVHNIASRDSRTQPDRIHGLDTLRSIAILTVMAFHIYQLHAANTIPAVLLIWIAIFAIRAFAASAVLYLLVERPFMPLRDKLLHQHTEPLERELRTEPAL